MRKDLYDIGINLLRLAAIADGKIIESDADLPDDSGLVIAGDEIIDESGVTPPPDEELELDPPDDSNDLSSLSSKIVSVLESDKEVSNNFNISFASNGKLGNSTSGVITVGGSWTKSYPIKGSNNLSIQMNLLSDGSGKMSFDCKLVCTDGSVLSQDSVLSFNGELKDYLIKKGEDSPSIESELSGFISATGCQSDGLKVSFIDDNQKDSVMSILVRQFKPLIDNTIKSLKSDVCDFIRNYDFSDVAGNNADKNIVKTSGIRISSEEVDIDTETEKASKKKNLDELIELLLTGEEIDEDIRHQLAGIIVELKNYRQHGCKKTPKDEKPVTVLPSRYPDDPSHPDMKPEEVDI